MILDFFKEQLDYIYFIYGLSFFILSAVCFMVRRVDRAGLNWSLLGLFAFIHGLNEWLDLLAVSFGDSIPYKFIRLCVMSLSFIFLFEFALCGLETCFKKSYASLLYPPVALIMLYGISCNDINLCNILARYSLCLSGGMLSAAAMFVYSKKIYPAGQKIKNASIAMALYALMSGLVTQRADFFPASVINAEAFLNIFMFPPQLLRGLCILFVAGCVYYHLNEIKPAKSYNPTIKKINSAGLNLFLSLFLVLMGWFLTDFLGKMALEEISANCDSVAEILSGRVREKLQSKREAALIVAGNDDIIAELKSVSKSKFERSAKLLEKYSAALSGSLIYVLDTSGVAIAASHQKILQGMLGHNYSFRKYFQQAMKGQIGEDFNRGLTTYNRGYYVCVPIKTEDGNIIGAAAIKSEIDDVEKDFCAYEKCFLVSCDGIIFASGIDGLQFTPMWPVSKEKLKTIDEEKVFDKISAQPLFKNEILNGGRVGLNGDKYYVRRVKFNDRWHIVIFSNLKRVSLFRVFGIVISCAAFFLILLFSIWVQYVHEAAYDIFMEKERLATTIKSIGEGVIVIDINAKILMINDSAKGLCGKKGMECVGENLSNVFMALSETSGERIENKALAAISYSRKIDFDRDSILIDEFGNRINIMVTSSPIIAGDAAMAGAVIVIKDVTHSRKMDEEMLRISQLKSIGALAGGIAHDFNNFLMAVTSNVELAKKNIENKNRLWSLFSRIESIAFKAKRLSAQFITFSSGGRPVKKNHDPSAIIKEITEFALSGSKVNCSYDISKNIRRIDIDESQFKQAVSNIVINAIQAMGEGGNLKIKAENIFLDDEAADARAWSGEYVKVSIIDTGSGIKQQDLSQIFNPYFTTKSNGMGLGLTVAYSIVKSHDGFIRVFSRPGLGSTFEIYFPASQNNGEKEFDDASGEAFEFKKKLKILLMEDETLIRETTSQLLNHVGYQTDCACDGREAVEMFKNAFERGCAYDIIVTDLTVPGGIGGLEMLNWLKSIKPDVKAIAVSGYADNPVASNYRAAGFLGYLPKPYKINDLNLLIQKILTESGI